MSEKKVYTLSIFNKEYTISTTEPEQDVRAAARLLDELLKEIGAALQANNESKVAVYAALKLAMDLIKKERNEAWSISMIERLIQQISSFETV